MKEASRTRDASLLKGSRCVLCFGGGDTHVSFWIAKCEARRFSQHDCIRIANAGSFEIERLGAERDVTVFLYIVGIDNHTAIRHATFIEHF